MSPPRTAGKIPCLDGLRALSILLVVFAHAAGTPGFPALSLDEARALGHFGVRIFFVISGYLITRLLVEEHAASGTISLPRFYFRRTFRLFPPLYVLVGAVSVLVMVRATALHRGDVVHALTYTMNYHSDRGWDLGHLWSLAVEEQFYLLWPAMVLLLGPRRAWMGAALAFVACPLTRFVIVRFFPHALPGVDETFETVADTLATGCLLALFRSRLDARATFVRIQSHPLAPLAAFAGALGVFQFQAHVTFSSIVGETLVNVLLALLVDAVIRQPRSFVGRVLEWRPVAWLGVLSYSIYLVQQPALSAEHTGVWFAAFPQNLLIVAVAALAMHYGVERPSFSVRARIEATLFPKKASLHGPAR